MIDDQNNSDDEVVGAKSESKETRSLNYCQLMRSARVMFAAVAGGLQYFNYCFMEPILANRLVEKKLSVM